MNEWDEMNEALGDIDLQIEEAIDREDRRCCDGRDGLHHEDCPEDGPIESANDTFLREVTKPVTPGNLTA